MLHRRALLDWRKVGAVHEFRRERGLGQGWHGERSLGRVWCPRRPPSGAPEELHRRRHQDRPDDRRIEEHGEGHAQAQFLDEDEPGQDESTHGQGQAQCGGTDDPSGAVEPEGHRLVRGSPRVMLLLHAPEQEHPVVGREPEDHGKDDDE